MTRHLFVPLLSRVCKSFKIFPPRASLDVIEPRIVWHTPTDRNAMPDLNLSSSSPAYLHVVRCLHRASPWRPLTLVLAAFALGCSEAPVATTADVPEGCVRTFHTGSRLPVVDCSGGTTDEQRRQAIADLQRVTPPKVGGQSKAGP
jgi:hypothetical protein